MTTTQQWRFWLIGLVISIFLLWVLRGVLMPFVAAMAVAYFLDPAADKLEDWGCSRMWATTIITVVFFIIVVAIAMIIVPVVARQLFEFTKNLPGYLEGLQVWITGLVQQLEARMPSGGLTKIRDAIGEYGGQAIKWLVSLIGQVWSGGMALANVLSLIFITPVVCFYLLRDWDKMTAKIDSWLPRDHADTIREQLGEIDRTLAGFVRGQGLVCLSLGLYYAIGLSLAGLQFGLIVGLVAGILSFIPYIGSMFALLASAGLAAAQFGDWQNVAIVVGIVLVGQFVEGNFLSPKLVGDRVRLHAVWIIFALLAGGTLLGFTGILLAVPVAAVIGVLSRFALRNYLDSPLFDRGGKKQAPKRDMVPKAASSEQMPAKSAKPAANSRKKS